MTGEGTATSEDTTGVETTGATTAATTGADTDATGTGSDTGTGAETETGTGTETDTETGTDTDTGDVEPVYPVPEWDVELPEDHGLDPDAIAGAGAVAAEYDSNCLVITRHGAIVGEWYWKGWDEDAQGIVFSVTKSLTSALFGIAEADGALDVEEPASAYIEEWQDGESADVTIRHLLSNDSGRHWDFAGDYLTMTFQDDRTQWAIERAQQHPPGTWWEYNNAAIQTLERVFSVATGVDPGAYAQANLFEPIGMMSSFNYDDAGNTLMYADMVASCRDLARFGYLYLRRGRWDGGVQVIPEDWVAESVDQPATSLNDAYGYLWWLNHEGHYVKPSTPFREEGDGLLVPEAPEGAYMAQGLKGQLIAVDPETEIVFTRIAEVPPNDLLFGTPVTGELWAQIMAAVVE